MRRTGGTFLLCLVLSGCSVVDAVTGEGEGEGDTQCPDESSLCYRLDTLTPPIEVQQIATGDFDGDGAPDIAAVDDTGDIYLLLNDDADEPGALTDQDLLNDFTAGPVAFAAGDFNGDGTSEVVGAFQSEGIVQMRGQTIGTFQEDVPTALAIVVADFDGDSYDDAAVAAEVGGIARVVILFGQDSGGFDSLRTEIDTTAIVQDLAVGDFDGDGDIDIAVITLSPDSLLQVFENDGNAGFTPHSPFAPCGGGCPGGGQREDPMFLVAGDFDGDGDDDLTVQVTCFDGCNTRYDAIRFLTAEKSIDTWREVRNWTLLGASDQLRGGDMDGDGSTDIVWQHRDEYLNLFVLHRDYFTTSLGGVMSLNVNDLAIDTILVDLNGDSYADIVTATDLRRIDVILTE